MRSDEQRAPMSAERLTDDQLTEMRHWAVFSASENDGPNQGTIVALADLLCDAVSEIDRLRAELAAALANLRAVATLRYIPLLNTSVDVVDGNREICPGCAQVFRRDESGWFAADSRHADTCVIVRVRAWVATYDRAVIASLPPDDEGEGEHGDERE